MQTIHSSSFWDPKEWETHVNSLLQIRHGQSNYFRIPDKHKGDSGIEGYSIDGVAYQSYAPEPCRVNELYDKQRDKLTTDINKFIANKEELDKLIYQTKINRWVLVVPSHVSKELIKIANQKNELVRGKNLNYVNDEQFRVQILDRTDFRIEEKVLLDSGAHKLKIEHADVLDKDISDFHTNDENNVKNISSKLIKLPKASQDKVEKTKNELIKRFIISENILDNLRTEFPEYHQDIEVIISKRESDLSIETIDGNGSSSLSEEAGKLTAILEKKSKLHEDNHEIIAWGAITDWLMRCPLDFE